MNDIVYDNDQDFCPQTLAINMYKQDIQIYIWIYKYIHSFAPGRSNSTGRGASLRFANRRGDTHRSMLLEI
ncbi:hypothetical protein BLOT_007971 [Blomia tropicalis]|nr:hypothetical protein BLOT_007971 [Blomia tropicalis]